MNKSREKKEGKFILEQDRGDRICKTGTEQREERKENIEGETGEYRTEVRRQVNIE
jgi:hypothetical protein